MCKVIINDEDGLYKTCFASNETPNQILRHFRIKPDTKVIYLNGTKLTKEDMDQPIPEYGTVHLVINNRTLPR